MHTQKNAMRLPVALVPLALVLALNGGCSVWRAVTGTPKPAAQTALPALVAGATFTLHSGSPTQTAIETDLATIPLREALRRAGLREVPKGAATYRIAVHVTSGEAGVPVEVVFRSHGPRTLPRYGARGRALHELRIYIDSVQSTGRRGSLVLTADRVSNLPLEQDISGLVERALAQVQLPLPPSNAD